MIIIYVLALLGGSYAGLTGSLWSIYIASLTFFVGLATLVRLYFTRKDKTNWDVSVKKKRFVPLFVLTLFFGIQYFVIRNFDSNILSSLFFLLFMWNIGFFLITLKIKLSGHLSILTLAVFQLVSWYGPVATPLFILIPFLSWSRMQLKRHTFKEVLIGIGYSSIIFLWLN